MQLIYLLICIVMWGLVYFFQNLAMIKIKDPYILQLYYSVLVVVLIIPVSIIKAKESFIIDRIPAIYLILASIAAVLGNILFLLSIYDNKNAGSFSAATASYSVVGLVLSFIFLAEEITLYKILGISCMIIGIMFLMK